MRRRDSSTRSPQRSEVAGSSSPPRSPAAGSSPPHSPPEHSPPRHSPPGRSSPRQSPAAGSSPPHSPARLSPHRAPAASPSGDSRKRPAASKPTRSRSRSKTNSRSRSRSTSSSSRSRRSRSRHRRRNNNSSSSSDRSSRGRSHSRSRSNTPSSVRVHVGNIGDDPSKTALMKAFDKFGNVQEVWLARTPPCFAFIVYRHREEAQRAVSEMNGQMLHGNRLKVSIARPRTRGQRGGAFNPYLRCYQCGVRGHFSRDCKEPDRRQGYSSGKYIGACLAVLSYRVARQAGTRRRGTDVCKSDRAHYGWYRECSKPGAAVVPVVPEEERPDNPFAPPPRASNLAHSGQPREELDSIKRLQVFSVISLLFFAQIFQDFVRYLVEF